MCPMRIWRGTWPIWAATDPGRGVAPRRSAQARVGVAINRSAALRRLSVRAYLTVKANRPSAAKP
jgi:hypothetical protein